MNYYETRIDHIATLFVLKFALVRQSWAQKTFELDTELILYYSNFCTKSDFLKLKRIERKAAVFLRSQFTRQ